MKRKREQIDVTEGTHERPWMWCMIDAFALVMAFFVCTFHVRYEEPVLPQALSKSGIGPGPSVVQGETLRVVVTHENGEAVYSFHSIRGTLADLERSLAGAKQSGRDFRVKVAYEGGVPFGDVLAVMNACTRQGITDIGMVPIRG